jgi:hypothetical protein
MILKTNIFKEILRRLDEYEDHMETKAKNKVVVEQINES